MIRRRVVTAQLLLALALSVAGCSGATMQAASPNLPPSPPGETSVSRVVSSGAAPARAGGVRASAQAFQIPLQAGWNLFSVPFTNLTTFQLNPPAAVLSCYSYDALSGTYSPQAFSQAGFEQSANPYTGYWVFCSSTAQLTLNGDSSAQAQLQTNLVQGWNLVGTPLANDVLATATELDSQTLSSAALAGLLGTQAFVYLPEQSAYQPISYQFGSFPAFQASWVFAFQPGTWSTTALGTSAALTNVTVTPPSLNLTSGTTAQLRFLAGFSDGTTEDLTSQATWSSSSPSLAAASDLGLVTAEAPGSLNVTATFGGLQASSAVTVTAPPVAPPEYLLGVEETPSGNAEYLHVYSVNASSGVPSEVPTSPLQLGSVTPAYYVNIIAHPKLNVFYLSLVNYSGPVVLRAFALAPVTGALTELAGSPFTTADVTLPFSLIDPQGAYIYAGDNFSAQGNATAGLAINADGSLTATPFTAYTPTFTISSGANGAYSQLAGFAGTAPIAYAAYEVVGSGSTFANYLQLLGFNSLTGALTEASPTYSFSPAPAPTSIGGYQVQLAPAIGRLYAFNGAFLNTFALDATGNITGPPVASVLPGVASETSVTSLAFTPSETFCYGGVEDFQNITNGLLGWSVDPSTGALTRLAGSPFSTPPTLSTPPTVYTQTLADYTGRFLYVNSGFANPDVSLEVLGYSIGSDGSLTPISGSPFFSTVNMPRGVTVIPVHSSPRLAALELRRAEHQRGGCESPLGQAAANCRSTLGESQTSRPAV